MDYAGPTIVCGNRCTRACNQKRARSTLGSWPLRALFTYSPEGRTHRSKLETHSVGPSTSFHASRLVASLLADEAAEEEARRSEVEASLLAEQQVGVAAVSAVTESQKKNLEDELEHAGATAEEKQARIRRCHRRAVHTPPGGRCLCLPSFLNRNGLWDSKKI